MKAMLSIFNQNIFFRKPTNLSCIIVSISLPTTNVRLIGSALSPFFFGLTFANFQMVGTLLGFKDSLSNTVSKWFTDLIHCRF